MTNLPSRNSVHEKLKPFNFNTLSGDVKKLKYNIFLMITVDARLRESMSSHRDDAKRVFEVPDVHNVAFGNELPYARILQNIPAKFFTRLSDIIVYSYYSILTLT